LTAVFSQNKVIVLIVRGEPSGFVFRQRAMAKTIGASRIVVDLLAAWVSIGYQGFIVVQIIDTVEVLTHPTLLTIPQTENNVNVSNSVSKLWKMNLLYQNKYILRT